MTTAALYEQERVHSDATEAARRQAAFLADVGTVLSKSLDYEETLATVARLAVPEIADWCTVDIVTQSGEINGSPSSMSIRPRWSTPANCGNEYPADPNASDGVREVIRTGTTRARRVDFTGAARASRAR